jgi:hypothetical protein
MRSCCSRRLSQSISIAPHWICLSIHKPAWTAISGACPFPAERFRRRHMTRPCCCRCSVERRIPLESRMKKIWLLPERHCEV